jgi:hypothetical protein
MAVSEEGDLENDQPGLSCAQPHGAANATIHDAGNGSNQENDGAIREKLKQAPKSIQAIKNEHGEKNDFPAHDSRYVHSEAKFHPPARP